MVFTFKSDRQRKWFFWTLMASGFYVSPSKLKRADVKIIEGDDTIYLGGTQEMDSQFWKTIRTFASLTLIQAYIDLVLFADKKAWEAQYATYEQYRVGSWPEALESLDQTGFAVYTKQDGETKLYTQVIGSGTVSGNPRIVSIVYRGEPK